MLLNWKQFIIIFLTNNLFLSEFISKFNRYNYFISMNAGKTQKKEHQIKIIQVIMLLDYVEENGIIKLKY